MNQVQMLRLFVCLPKVSRLTACQFCVSNRMEKSEREKSVFERYMDFQMENKGLEEGQQEKSQLNSLNSVGETEQSDKIDSVGQLNFGRKNSESLLTNETLSSELKTKTHNKDYQDQVNNPIEINSESSYLTEPSQNENKISDILKSATPIQTSYNPLKYILNCKLIPDDVNSALQDEDYLLFHEHLEKLQILALPSVSQVIARSVTDNKILTNWKKNQIKLLGKEGFDNSLKAMKKTGLDFHHTIQKYLSGEKDVEISEDIQGHWNSIEHILDSFEEGDIKMTEVAVEHPLLHYTGGCDCIAVYRKKNCIIEWKTSKKTKPFLSTTRNFPVQAAAYLGAVNTSFDSEFQKLGPVTNAVVVVAYSTGQPAHAHYMNDKMVDVYWKQWLQTLYSYWTKQKINQDSS